MMLHYETYGKGPPLIILHGLFGSLKNWRFLSPRLGVFCQVFALDLRNHGDSPHDGAMSYQLLAEDVREFMKQRELSTSNVLGHSMGGRVAMELAFEYPECVDRLIVLDVAPRPYSVNIGLILDALETLDLDSYQSRKQVDEALKPYLRDRTLRQFLLTNLKRDQQNNFTWRMNLQAIRANYEKMSKTWDPSKKFIKPTLFITGEKSDYVTRDDLPLISQVFAESKVQSLAKAGHWVHDDQPEECLELIKNFLVS